MMIQCLIDGWLNVGNIAGANTLVQDVFNQHSVVPHANTLIKIIEFALANDLVYEGKRQVAFIQQLMNWQPNRYTIPEVEHAMAAFQNDRRVSKEALQHLFRYFGFELHDEDIF
mmetsp:Transcript_16932/g.25871  ORF Transcript_16932/g.25871 Transcript_16932/m.25871 type:complete len:114 (+) Transcript_16932:1-342(+)